jgi:phosphatidylglycerophosphate synthase
MLALSFGLLLITALFGGALAALHQRQKPPAWQFGAMHGGLGAIGLVALLLALRGPPRGVAMGVGAFGQIATVLLAMALIAGFAIMIARLRDRRVPGLVIGIHATIAISGVVILAAYTLVG